MEKPVFLIGFMGSGKTTWGKKLANALSLPFIDMDQEIVQKTGVSIPTYFEIHGEQCFRALEREVLHEQKGKKAIVSTGGGAPCYFDNMDWILEHGLALYLHHTPKSLWSRLSKSNIHKRPALKGLVDGDLLALIEEKLAERSPYYDRAHIIIDQINTTLNQIVAIVHEHQIKQA